MDRAARRRLENKLREKRDTLERQLRPEASEWPDEPDPLARRNEEMAVSLENIWRRAVAAQIREIDSALDKLRKGAFGICEECDEPIAPKRLEAIPWARKCLSCQRVYPEKRARLEDSYKPAASPRYSNS